MKKIILAFFLLSSIGIVQAGLILTIPYCIVDKIRNDRFACERRIDGFETMAELAFLILPIPFILLNDESGKYSTIDAANLRSQGYNEDEIAAKENAWRELQANWAKRPVEELKKMTAKDFANEINQYEALSDLQ